MAKRHHMQLKRDRNLRILRGWIKEIDPLTEEKMPALIKRCCVVMGCTEEKAREYIRVST